MTTHIGSAWKSVRPVRFRSEIFGTLDYIKTVEKVSLQQLAKHTLQLRIKTEEKRLEALGRQRSLRTRTKDPRRQPYLTESQQLVRVLRSTGFINVQDGLLFCTERAQTLLEKEKQDEIGADVFFLERLINSRFQTYWLYLKQLYSQMKVTIPRRLSKRDTNLKAYLELQGFPLSVWSFYIIRDLFYDFGLLNYEIEEQGEKIFPVYSLDVREMGKYAYHIKGLEGNVNFWKKVDMTEFEDITVRSYLELVGGWDRIADLISLREKVSETLKISERQFNIMLQKFARQPEGSVSAHPSIGTISSEKRKGYMTKVLSLPTSERGYLLTLIRISRVGARI
jgi:hypothetical protein